MCFAFCSESMLCLDILGVYIYHIWRLTLLPILVCKVSQEIRRSVNIEFQVLHSQLNLGL